MHKISSGAQHPTEVGATQTWLAVFLLGLVHTVSYMDRQVLVVLAQAIKDDLRLTDTHIGLLTGVSFAFFYTIAAVPIAHLADRVNRIRIIAAACSVWSIFTVATAFATNFTQIALMRIGVGAGEAGSAAPSMSVIADRFPPAQRSRATGIFLLGAPAGVMLGTALGAAIGAAHGWRSAFIMLGAPGLLISLVILVLLREPQRGATETGTFDAPTNISFMDTARALFVRQDLRWLTIGCALCSFVSVGIANWGPTYLIRSKSMTLMEISVYFSLAASISIAIGLSGSGILADRLGKGDARAYAWLPALGMAIGLPFFIGAVLAPGWELSLSLLFVPMCMASAMFPPAVTFVQNNAVPSQRATSVAVFLLVVNLTGFGGGSLFVGVISDFVASRGVGDPLAVAISTLSLFFIPAIGALLLAARAIGRKQIRRSKASEHCTQGTNNPISQ